MAGLSDTALALGLEGKGVLVTGAAGVIGAQVARVLAAAGARVFATDAATEALEAARASLPGERHSAEAADLRSAAACHALVARAAQALGRLDALVAVHALLIRRELTEVDEAEFDLQMAVNAKAQFFLSQAALPHLVAQGGGRIVLYSSVGGFVGSVAAASAYTMTKSAALGLCRSLARRHGPDGITCNIVSPGSVDTPMLRQGLTEADMARLRDAIPLRRFGAPEELALATLFLVSRWGGFVNGQVLTVDGGASMGAFG